MTEYEQICQLRDEVRLKIHLAGADTRDLFERLEKKWQELGRRLQPVKTAGREAAADISDAARLLMGELGEGYRHVKKALAEVLS